MIPAVLPAFTMMSKHGFADIMHNSNTGEKSLHAASFFDAGDVLCTFEAQKTLETPDRFSLQIGDNKHILLHPECLQHVNHGCDPNVFFDTASMQLIALRAIQPGDELLFFYPSTEWEMAEPFECQCGAPQCLHLIQGASALTDLQVMPYRLTSFIREKIQNRSIR